ncbi:LysR family transcriptional regulator [Paraburkholderia sp. BL25I1N1]|uniref:LysR family transcriptional regulator n=1 Tax=Paraburkholderia sp. BL25I1N1 TaxID=1938804 RepID=UPI000D0759C9|nr:LysR family transcriptional regulator [Paraburkholderia sp. BL25I1N1]PRX91773.1 DNA-binding transcriptional LysR family regulator [Paraburkholderia sp. BL25I1N1]
MNEPTLFQLQCFEALVSEGSFAAAAAHLNRTHPTVHAAVAALEAQVGMVLLDRTGYRVSLTAQGAAFCSRATVFLGQYESLRREAAQLAAGQEAELRVVVGDLCPLPETLGSLRRFFETSAGTRLTLLFEAISGPWERLRDGECDLFFHHLDKPSPEIEAIELFEVHLVPVAAPGFIKPRLDGSITIDDLRPYVQCVIRDTSRQPSAASYYLIEGAPACTVPDQLMKRELIVQGLAWGHMPSHLVADDLMEHRLVSLEGRNLRGAALKHYAARRRHAVHGPVAQTLWTQLQELKIG